IAILDGDELRRRTEPFEHRLDDPRSAAAAVGEQNQRIAVCRDRRDVKAIGHETSWQRYETLRVEPSRAQRTDGGRRRETDPKSHPSTLQAPAHTRCEP